MKCPKCQAENPEGMNFCGKCGYDLKKVVETHSDTYSEPTSYTPKFLADKILTTRSAIEGERKMVSVLFADVANSTSLVSWLNPVWFFVTSQYVPVGPLRHPVIFFNTAKTCR